MVFSRYGAVLDPTPDQLCDTIFVASFNMFDIGTVNSYIQEEDVKTPGGTELWGGVYEEIR